jgi:tRNA (guanine37-N1)-methyltransferase
MVMKPEPVGYAIESYLARIGKDETAAIVLTDPIGEKFEQEDAIELADYEAVLFICGHYEGIDDRIRQLYATHVFTIGDFILTGGELPALVMADATCRNIQGVLGSEQSLAQDSHSDGLLSCPQFTRPEEFKGIKVPEVLKSGDHKKIAKWKRQQALKLTRENRPDLFSRANLAKSDSDLLSY